MPSQKVKCSKCLGRHLPKRGNKCKSLLQDKVESNQAEEDSRGGATVTHHQQNYLLRNENFGRHIENYLLRNENFGRHIEIVYYGKLGKQHVELKKIVISCSILISNIPF